MADSIYANRFRMLGSNRKLYSTCLRSNWKCYCPFLYAASTGTSSPDGVWPRHRRNLTILAVSIQSTCVSIEILALHTNSDPIFNEIKVNLLFIQFFVILPQSKHLSSKDFPQLFCTTNNKKIEFSICPTCQSLTNRNEWIVTCLNFLRKTDYNVERRLLWYRWLFLLWTWWHPSL